MSYVGNKPPIITIPADDSVTSAMIVDGTIRSGDMAVDPRNATNLNAGDVPLAQLDNVDTSGIISNRDDIALLGFKVAANGSLAKYNLVDQTVDDFQDTSGVNASSSTNEARDSSGKYYKGETSTTPTASGGTITTDGDYKIHTFTADANYINDTPQTVDYLLVAGGAGGGGTHTSILNGAGGGGAGGFRYLTSNSMAAGTFAVVIGQGGAAGPATSDTQGSDGTATTFNSVSAAGGGGGGSAGQAGGMNGRDGGSGGGGGTTSRDGGSGNTPSTSPVQGYDGGDTTGANGGSGGGGASATPSDSSGYVGTTGGAGLSNSITGSAVTYAGGGSGGSRTGYASSPGSAGGGGGSGNPGSNGTDALGGGGGGSDGGSDTAGGDGGNGIFILRRPTDDLVEGGNMTLVSTTTAAQAAPTKGDIVMTYTNGAGTTTLDTDLTAEISADGGSTWTALALGSEGSTGSHNIATAHDVTISSTITAPWNMAYRIKTLNQSVSKTTRIQAVSLGWS